MIWVDNSSKLIDYVVGAIVGIQGNDNSSRSGGGSNEDYNVYDDLRSEDRYIQVSTNYCLLVP